MGGSNTKTVTVVSSSCVDRLLNLQARLVRPSVPRCVRLWMGAVAEQKKREKRWRDLDTGNSPRSLRLSLRTARRRLWDVVGVSHRVAVADKETALRGGWVLAASSSRV